MDEISRRYPVGSVIEGTVESHFPFGIFVEVGLPIKGLVQIIDFEDNGIMTPDRYPAIGSKISAVVLGFAEKVNNSEFVWLSTKPSVIVNREK